MVVGWETWGESGKKAFLEGRWLVENKQHRTGVRTSQNVYHHFKWFAIRSISLVGLEDI